MWANDEMLYLLTVIDVSTHMSMCVNWHLVFVSSSTAASCMETNLTNQTIPTQFECPENTDVHSHGAQIALLHDNSTGISIYNYYNTNTIRYRSIK